MRMYARAFIPVTAILISFTLCGCHRESEKRVVSIIKFVPHPALDEMEIGFTDVVEDAIRTNPALKNFQIEHTNANRNPQRAKELAEIATRSDVKLIFAIATPAAQAVSKIPSEIPLLYGAVADPMSAGIIPSKRATGIKNVGPAIVRAAVEFILKFAPHTKVIGTLYNPGEQNSVYVQDILVKICNEHGVKLVQQPVYDTSQVASMAEDLTNQADVIYSANDNTVNAAIASVVAVAKAKRKPFFIGDLSSLKEGAVAAIGLEYKSMGRSLGEMAIKILSGIPISQIEPQEPPTPEIWLNSKVLNDLNLTISPGAKKLVNKTI